ncbi:erythrocyte membrane protein 1, PfEMP1, putative [Plasmodium sp.]|nr:erythrocyte membrane protein 1, PfEMP1, putative [Plasmodium sp.]
MAPPPSLAPSTSTTYNSVKDLLEEIGGTIQQEAHTKAVQRGKNALQGNLSEAKFNGENNKTTDPCALDHTKHTNVKKDRQQENPCHGREPERFSDARSGQCTYNRIKDSVNRNNKVGACAPYRRLHICDYNLENIDAEKITNTHNLLADVLLAAQHEGDMITKKIKEYDESNYESRICTVLARSFADIGDIIRGKDLYLGNKTKNENLREKEKLEIKLKSFFKNIYNNLTEEGKQTYQDNDGNYFKLREDWWALNRNDVWKAITCNAPDKANYFIYKSGSSRKFSDDNCGHNQANVPTDLDYVPQFLRWFDEWADDFCRIKKIKLKLAKNACRDNSQQLYCSHNGYDCTKPNLKKDACSREFKCTGCSTKCKIYEHWLGNQRNEFKKQTKKYEKEMKTYVYGTGMSNRNINNEYYENFYKKLKEKKYENHDDFLKLLNKGKYCKEGFEGEKDIDFTKADEKGIFYRSDYCQVCPDCVVDCDNGECVVKRNTDGSCIKPQTYTPPQDVTPTEIKVLFSGENQKNITEKLSSFCSNPENKNDTNYQKWKCYYKNSVDNNCEMKGSSYKDPKYPNIMISDECFHLWVKNLLIDTIKWETKLKNCINNTNVTDCDNECIKNCECFDNWIKTKENEWKDVKNVYKNQKETLDIYYKNLQNLFDSYFFEVMNELNNEEKGKWDQFTEDLKKKMDYSKGKAGTEDSQDSIKVLFDHLKENATTCVDNNSKESCENSGDFTSNPCSKNNNSGKLVRVKQIAEEKQRDAREQLEDGAGESKLKGDAKLGQYERKGTASVLTDICKITKDHSNSTPGQTEGPCHGKDEDDKMFEMEYGWTPTSSKSITHNDFYMSPRREHICTSNLEFLETYNKPLNGMEIDKNAKNGKLVNDSFLGDVLLSAKYEAENIKKKYEKQPGYNDGETMCRAIRYSFADLGDIIRGRDMWDLNDASEKMDVILKEIFATLHESLDGIKKNPKYIGDEHHKPAYKLLREDWWEANRHQVWRAMKCTTKNISNNKCNGIPIEDYIPQKLRWMTELAEWYCKVQKKEYEDLVNKCGDCMGKDKEKKCMNDTEQCKKCKAACKIYGENMGQWQEQWNEISDMYEILYKQGNVSIANRGVDNSTATKGDKDRNVIEFLCELQKAIGDTPTATIPPKPVGISSNRMYENVAAYVHDTGNFSDCKKQNVFCKSGNIDTDYVFRDKPQDHDEMCDCKDGITFKLRPQEAGEAELEEKTKKKKGAPATQGAGAAKEKKQKEEKDVVDACNVVKELLKGNNRATQLHGCRTKRYNGWDCNKRQFQSGHDGACMPPRRKKLCISDLETSTDITEDGLKNSFINCAATETHFAWENYKCKHNGSEQNLENGKIPDDFLKIMKYTYADYRDMVFGTDISKSSGINKIRSRIDKVLKDKNGQERKSFWNNNASAIWKAMICALQSDIVQKDERYIYDKLKPNLEEFGKKPQFLRWYIEWSDEFCRERKKLEDTVSGACSTDYEGCEKENSRGSCVSACKEYKKYITAKKTQYDSQEGKFNIEKTTNPEYKSYSKKDTSEYLEKGCLDAICSCIGKVKSNVDYWEKPHTTYETTTLQTKCECKPPPSACDIVDSILGNKSSTGYREGCRKKYMTRSIGWLCNEKEGGKGGKEDDDVCIPRRRQRLYVKELETLGDGEVTQVQLREAFIKCAAIETFFSWYEFKKEKEREKAQNGLGSALPFFFGQEQSQNEDPQKQLEIGDIPDEFKRQMFYTLADYRDICLGKDIGIDMKAVSEKIKGAFKNGGKKSSKTSTPKDWWDLYAKDIWDGMVCALSYDTEKKEMIPALREKLIGDSIYNYNSIPISDGTSLSDFVKRPQYFRWLEEWGEEFCRKRKDKLAQIKVDCRGDSGQNYCDGDGFDCTNMRPNKNEIFNDFNCSSCAKSCNSYKQWINTKKKEFNKQNVKYEKERKKFEGNFDNIYNTNFVRKLSTDYTSIKLFLENLKGPCSNTNNNREDKIDFTDQNKTFGHAEYCSPCPVFGVKCIKDDCSKATEKMCQEKTILTVDDIGQKKIPIEEVVVLVSDNNSKDFADDLGVCEGIGVFKGIRKDEWTCVNMCESDLCVLKNFKEGIHDKQNVLIRTLFKLWLENFLKDYNKIKDEILYCTNNDKESKCINGCKKKCNCLYKWIEKKKKEWQKVRNRYLKPFAIQHSKIYYDVRRFVEMMQPKIEVQKVKGDFKELRDLEESNGCTYDDPLEKHKEKDVVECLLNKLEKEIESCKNQTDDGTLEKCPAQSKDAPLEDDTPYIDISPGILAPPFCNVPANPCSDQSVTNVVGIYVVAEETQKEAHKNMLDRSVKKDESDSKGIKGAEGDGKSESVLKGDIKNAKFKNKIKPNELNKVCDITKEYTNDKRGNPAGGACEGKDGDNGGERMKIGTIWKTGDRIQIKDPHLYLPPRRQHICTSNLEKINVGNVIGNSNVNDSFLWDVLLAAKMDAQKINDLYKSQNGKTRLTEENDKATVCRAMKYSFADIGDIIRGKDLWEHHDFKELERELVKIFKKIKEELQDALGDKYASDKDGKHTQLREDWWEANRDQIWEAMICAPSRGNPPCTNKTTPYDDYIPQRLRWMTEWAEWYCKMQKKEYEELEKTCDHCRSKGRKCMNGDHICNSCKEACDNYNKKIKHWEDQWTKIKDKYEELYKKTTTTDTTTSSNAKDEKDIVAFLKKLQEKNKESNTIYATAAGYIHQEAKYIDCKTQTQFCDKKNDETSSTGKDNDKYTFKKPPPEYQQACDCNTRKPVPRPPPPPPLPPPPPPPSWKKPKKACELVWEILSGNYGNSKVGNCYQKGTYPDWTCDESKIKSGEQGACMPPRRQKLCLYYLTQLSYKDKEEKLREAFIKTAAAETFLSWQYYKSNHNDAEQKLKAGKIPPEFLRSMFYTYADYRDLCLEKDISNDVDSIKDNIKYIFTNSTKGKRESIDTKRQKWWNAHGPEIWEGMLCALKKAQGNETLTKNYHYEIVTFNDSTIHLETFASRPPFLRWFTEWGEHFCKEQKNEFNTLKEKCNSCIVSDSGTKDGTGNKTCDDKEKCGACKEQCKEYKKKIETWKKHYTSQNEKFKKVKEREPYNKDLEAKNAKDTRDYLGKQLQNMKCTNGNTNENCKYTCMDTTLSTNSEIPKSLDDEPEEVRDKCNCIRDECSGLSVTGSGFSHVSAFGAGIPSESCKGFEEQVPIKKEPPTSDYINDILKSTIPVGIALALGSIAFLFIKKKPKSPVDLLRVLDIHKGDYGIPTPKSSNTYIPYVSDTYKGKTYIYMEGDTSGDEKYAFMSDTTDVTSSESEYEEMDINDIYPYTSPKYKTLIEVVLEPSKNGANTPSKGDDEPLGDDMVSTTNRFTDEEWNELKHDFISQYVQRESMGVPQYDVSTELPMNTTEGNVLDDGMKEKPFITSIHDRDLYSGEEISYNINMSTNSMDDPKYVSNNVYSGIDLINDTLSGNKHIDIYDEVLKRKENELFGTNYKKNTSNNSVAKLTNNDPIMNQLDLLHKWLDRHRDMCEKWNNKEELLDKLNEEWNKDNNVGDIPNDNKTLNTNVSFEIDMDETKGKKEFSNMDTILDNIEDDIYYDVNDDENPSVDDIPMDHNKVDVPKKVHVEMKIHNNTFNGSLEPEFPISDIWNI